MPVAVQHVRGPAGDQPAHGEDRREALRKLQDLFHGRGDHRLGRGGEGRRDDDGADGRADAPEQGLHCAGTRERRDVFRRGARWQWPGGAPGGAARTR